MVTVNAQPLFDKGFNVINTHLLGLLNLVKYYKKSKLLEKFIQIGSGDEYGNNIMPSCTKNKKRTAIFFSIFIILKYLQIIL